MGSRHEMSGAGQFGGGHLFTGHPGFGGGPAGFRPPRNPINVEFRGPANDDGGRQPGHWPPPGGAPDDGANDRSGGWFHVGRHPQGGDDGRPGHGNDPDCPPKHGEEHHHGGGFWGAVGRFFGVHRNYDYPVDYYIPPVAIGGGPQSYYAGQPPGAATAAPPPPPNAAAPPPPPPPPPPPTPVTKDVSTAGFDQAQYATGKHDLATADRDALITKLAGEITAGMTAQGLDTSKAGMATEDFTAQVAGHYSRLQFKGDPTDAKNKDLGAARGADEMAILQAAALKAGFTADHIHLSVDDAASRAAPPSDHAINPQSDRVGLVESVKVTGLQATADATAANTTTTTVVQPPVDTSGFVALDRNSVQQLASLGQGIKRGLVNGDFTNGQVVLPSTMLFAQGEDRSQVSGDTLAAREQAVIGAMNVDPRTGKPGRFFSDANNPSRSNGGATVAFADTPSTQTNGDPIVARMLANPQLGWQKPDAAGATVGQNGALGGQNLASLKAASAGDLAAAAPPPPPGDAPLNGASVAAAIQTGMNAGASSQPPPAAKSAAASRLFMMDRG